MASTESDDETPQLSQSTLAILQGFYAEKDEQQRKFDQLCEEAEDTDISMAHFSEDWNASQFWYEDATALKLAHAMLDGAGADTIIGIVSAPSAFVQIRKLLATIEQSQRPTVYLFEYDRRFEVFKEFVYYDFEQPTALPADLKGRFNRILCDPPFLSEDCQTKAALTVRWLLAPSDAADPSRVVLCTGERMESLAVRLYRAVGLRTTSFEPKHAKGLSNEFRCYANFETSDWTLLPVDTA